MTNTAPVNLSGPFHYSQESLSWIKNNAETPDNIPPSSVHIVSWNVDFAAPFPEERLQGALSHLQNEVFHCADGTEPTSCLILFQEVYANAIVAILENPWIQTHFFVVPISDDTWARGVYYGNITLISKKINVVAVKQLTFLNSMMGRNALIVDVLVQLPHDAKTETGILRIANTHLESLRGHGTKVRPVQLGLAAEALREEHLYGGIIAGDMNAIQESDLTTPKDVGLSDAYQGDENDEKGFTWGYQPRCQFPPARLDKVLYTRRDGLVVAEPKLIGVGVKTVEEHAWLSDHYGMVTTVAIGTQQNN
ncbi:hypothetical protein BD410DRAFT_784015 [Rickenella mellea]|uniref:Endonuclease/exonuclease/phosphatase domain-containing protein n=1 Tax=Rickenella mellea TaxID=50990 RepID=A0A4Y7QF17_9AGAM|nr:hypothetical protein BD410DRAFT_784015 [Rickenella mellea]